MTDKQQIRQLVDDKLRGTEQFLVDIKLSPGRLAVFIDKPSGISLDECTAMTRYLLEQLEPTGFLESHDVEVGSPGMDSPMMVPQQYLRRIGREIRVFTADKREIKGILEHADDNGIRLKEQVSRRENKQKIMSEVEHTLTYADIREARLMLNFKLK